MLTRPETAIIQSGMLWKFLTEIQAELKGVTYQGKPITRYRMAKWMRVAPNSYLDYIDPESAVKRIPADAIPNLVAELQKLDPKKWSWENMGKRFAKHFIKVDRPE